MDRFCFHLCYLFYLFVYLFILLSLLVLVQQCNCQQEFDSLIENYETRLREMENTVSDLVGKYQNIPAHGLLLFV